MSETPVDRHTVIDKHHEEQTGSAEAVPHGSGSRSLKAGGEFLRALGADLGAATSRVRLSLAAKRRRPQPPPAPTPTPTGTSPGPGIGRGIWRAGMVFFGALVICSGLLSAAMLYVIFGSPLAPRHSDPGAPALRAEAPSSPSVGPSAEATIQPAPPPATAEQPKPIQEANAEPPANPNPPPPAPPGDASVATAPGQPSPPAPVGAAEQPKPIQEANAEPPAGSNQPQPVPTETQAPSPQAGQPEISAKLTDQRPGVPCNVDLCAATYKSFHAADCTYQPIGGGPRSICELGAQPAAAAPQISRAATESSTKPTDARAAALQPVATSAAPDQAGSQCNRPLCAATYKSFRAADCTYQPEGGGPRGLCDLVGPDKGPTDALQQPSRTATDARHSPSEADDNDDSPAAGMAQEIAEPATPDRDGPQCNRSRCAATYQSFHASDCTYQPEGGGPRRLCEP